MASAKATSQSSSAAASKQSAKSSLAAIKLRPYLSPLLGYPSGHARINQAAAPLPAALVD
jgi:hypothetical protein